ncbi:MAG TPA: four helix bundle protein [Gemmatimonadaceae bacterium]|nr:four helix bundle protein [Gemmatimonadaceae bacterium]
MDYRRLRVWRLADEFAFSTYRLVSALPPKDRYGIGEQLWRAALSVPSNIVEGYTRDSTRQLLYHVNVAIGSLAESLYLLDLATRLGLLHVTDARTATELGVDLRPRLRAFAGAVRGGRSRFTGMEDGPTRIPSSRVRAVRGGTSVSGG